jgi:hypothetical protein
MDEHGGVIQKRLLELLKLATPFVKTEASALMFDVVAYIPDNGKVGLGKREFVCEHKYDTKHCTIMREAMLEEFSIKDERQAIDKMVRSMEDVVDRYMWRWSDEVKKVDWCPFNEAELKALKKGFDGVEQLFWRKYPDYRIGDMEYQHDGTLWGAIKGMCVCMSEGCPSAFQSKWEGTNHELRSGLHCFEVKGDLDNFSRLSKQVLKMQQYADNVWLVLGERQEIPEWLPPYVGVMQYIADEDNFTILRSGEALWERWRLHNQVVLEDHECKIQKGDQDFIASLLKKWAINSLFRWNFGGVIVEDMSEELAWLAGFKGRIRKELGIKEKLDKLQKKVVDDWE